MNGWAVRQLSLRDVQFWGGWPKLGTGILWMGDTQDRVQEMAEMGLVCLFK